jgi:hypothetical protein
MTNTPGGWYTDPADPAKLRWWDGAAWTPNTVPQPPPLPTAQAQEGAATTQRHAAEQLRREAEYVPFARDWEREATANAATSRRPRSQTLPIWFLATSPIWVGTGYDLFKLLEWNAPLWVQSTVGGVLTIALLFGLAVLDGSRLYDRGFQKSASPAWILLLPVYFIVRAVRVGLGGVWPLITFFLANVGVALLVLLPILALYTSSPTSTSPGTSHSLTAAERAGELTPSGLTTKFKHDLELTGKTVQDITCVPFPDTNANTTTTCTVTSGGTTTVWRLRVSPEVPQVAFVVDGIEQ